MQSRSTPGEDLRILVVDDHATFRKALTSAIDLTDGFQVAGEAGGGEEACAQALALEPDVILMDLSMPDLSGIEAMQRIRTTRPDQRVVILTAHADSGVRRDALAAGASALLPKGTPLDELIEALQAAAVAPVDLVSAEGADQGADQRVDLTALEEEPETLQP